MKVAKVNQKIQKKKKSKKKNKHKEKMEGKRHDSNRSNHRNSRSTWSNILQPPELIRKRKDQSYTGVNTDQIK